MLDLSSLFPTANRNLKYRVSLIADGHLFGYAGI
jgi:hypothetical protein